ncbi:NAD(P)-dependent oxidoreductase [Jiangella asiatica]|nr:NAD(P)-binding domain-containing protein [Jiangella asiatica]
MDVSVLGLGAMGSALAGALLRAGHSTTVWNRSPGKTGTLAGDGARGAETARQAVAASDLVVVCVTDYAAANDVLDAAGDTLRGRTVVNLTTGTPDEAHDVATMLRTRGAGYLDGVAHAQPEQVGTASATLLYGGDPELFQAHAATLRALGDAVHVGADPRQAGLYDLALMGLWYEAELAFLNALALVGSSGVDAETFVPFGRTQLGYVVDALPDVAAQVRDRSYPRGPATLEEHARVLAQLGELRASRGMNSDHLAHVDRVVRRLIGAGHGGEGFTRVVEELALPLTD